ncbi:hypothetical protein BU24DRAFT_492971 [Aaosphaeria arxii CBS 175.79]|uniref:MYND-type domain-containing protein n=1 Tax=Aaosphaeria arxii CBS 175.79 TaxID=1450172 RepID=A0A6A5XNG2_9PLEO|nr:uncharacterized protein BU24DRAFT_492971 [Aaosphaeria arxii CBS 175.79]KAF2014311.1 hypothetical protein BU24DRAFT_492971 [Aaosphaeria arxii CBS 175.79]
MVRRHYKSVLFRTDADFDALSRIEDLFNMMELELDMEEIILGEDLWKLHLSLYRPWCTHTDVILVELRELFDIIARTMERHILSDTQQEEFNVHEYMILGACAMSYGFRLPNPSLVLMKELYTEGEFCSEVMQRFEKALFGPHDFQNGVPFDFESKELIETTTAVEENEQSSADEESEIVKPLGILQKSIEDPWRYHVINEIRDMRLNPGDCGGCGAKQSGTQTFELCCGWCGERVYCSKRCQRAHWKAHKKVCDRHDIFWH